MGLDKIIGLAIEKGVSFVLSGLVIYFLIQLIKHAPAVIKEFMDLSKNSTMAMEQSIDVIKDTKEMHTIMDQKIDTIQVTINELKDMINGNSAVSIELVKKLERLEQEVSDLKKEGGGLGKF